jgi:hypothetical protein
MRHGYSQKLYALSTAVFPHYPPRYPQNADFSCFGMCISRNPGKRNLNMYANHAYCRRLYTIFRTTRGEMGARDSCKRQNGQKKHPCREAGEKTSFCLSVRWFKETVFYLVFREIAAPRAVSFSSRYSYPRSMKWMLLTQVVPLAASPATISEAPARRSDA